MKTSKVLATLATAAVVALLPGVARADVHAGADSRGDVQAVKASDLGSDQPTTTPAPTRANGDVTRFRVSHTDRAVIASLRFRDLARQGRMIEHEFRYASPKGQRVAVLVSSAGHWAGRLVMLTGQGKKVDCKGASWKIDYVRNTVRLSVPAACLGNPGTVRVGAATVSLYNGSFYYDDASRTGGGFFDPIRLGPGVPK